MSTDKPLTGLNVPKSLLMAQKIANLSDTAIKIPFTRITLGLDFIIGLIPVVGDFIMLCVAATLIIMGKAMGMPKRLLFAMMRNTFIDFLIGLIPFLGDIADIFYKSNRANVRLMERWWLDQNKQQLDQQTQLHLDSWQLDPE
ncbi:DUF4112 domain-containing protein [Aliiglaciecola sp. LCG003]|uniref:DUF4112 domain-containing protein n=1 Tax=Aliiglaciecola sp. LCG003 TaxID=3053655 RepID=UPI0025722463|nr:DUF4112 domain-containing protein [Aliiglaciecola sp. LCG003]WJG09809.1 DUF4112 domain-containing protein [Aliiglaciecola sp. LCG003]